MGAMKALIAFDELAAFMIALVFIALAFSASQRLFLTHDNIGSVMAKCEYKCFEGITLLSPKELEAYNISVEGKGRRITLLKTDKGFIARLS